jgi:hypothetical protein
VGGLSHAVNVIEDHLALGPAAACNLPVANNPFPPFAPHRIPRMICIRVANYNRLF